LRRIGVANSTQCRVGRGACPAGNGEHFALRYITLRLGNGRCFR
jgi:hypothetical protein